MGGEFGRGQMRRRWSTIFQVWLPAILNWSLAIFAFFVSYQDFKNAPFICYLIVLAAFIGLCASVLGFLNDDLGPKRSLVATIVQGAALLFIFAGVYRGYGLLYGGQPASTTSAADALYFSAVTWTTLGYGDFTPPEAIRLVAAIEALLGYSVFGTAVGLGTFLLCSSRLSRR